MNLTNNRICAAYRQFVT